MICLLTFLWLKNMEYKFQNLHFTYHSVISLFQLRNKKLIQKNKAMVLQIWCKMEIFGIFQSLDYEKSIEDVLKNVCKFVLQLGK